MIPRPLPRRRARGSVIILVLVTVLLVAFLLTKFVQRAGTELMADARAGDRARLRREAYSALEATLAVLADLRITAEGLHSPAQGWEQALEYAGHVPAAGLAVAIEVGDESGKISLPRADAATLEVLLEVLGLGRNEAERIADALLAWTHPDHVANAPEVDGGKYERAALPYQPALRPLRSFGELASVAYAREFFFDDSGQPTALAREFEANVSLYSFDRVNLNAATPVALAVGGLDTGQIDALQSHLRRQRASDRQKYFRTAGEAATVLGPAAWQAFGSEAAALRVTVTVRGGATAYRLSAVVAPPGGATLAMAAGSAEPDDGVEESAPVIIKKLDYPFKVLEIRENLESTLAPAVESPAHD